MTGRPRSRRVDASTYRVDFGELQVNDLVVGAQILEGAVTGAEGVSSLDSIHMTAAPELACGTVDTARKEW